MALLHESKEQIIAINTCPASQAITVWTVVIITPVSIMTVKITNVKMGEETLGDPGFAVALVVACRR